MTDRISPGAPSVDVPEGAGDRAAYVRALIAGRCPELTEADLAKFLAGSSQPDPDAGIPVEIADQILDVLHHLMDRMSRLEQLARE